MGMVFFLRNSGVNRGICAVFWKYRLRYKIKAVYLCRERYKLQETGRERGREMREGEVRELMREAGKVM